MALDKSYGIAKGWPMGGGQPLPVAPSFTVNPSISGSLSQGSLLTGNDGTFSNGTVSAREWQRDAVAIPGAIGATYTLVLADVGAFISYRVTVTGISSVSATSTPVGPITASAGVTNGILLENGTDFLMMEDGTSFILQEV